jgi:protein SCO1/2
MTPQRIIKNPFLWAFLVGIASLHIIKECALSHRGAPQPLVLVPDWSLIDQDGRPFGKKDLSGHVVIVDFFFTSCPSICPKVTGAMKEIYQRFKDKTHQVQFVSITVDPDTDTPEVLKGFMEKNDIAVTNWHSLTGNKTSIYEVVVEKMRVHMGEKEFVAQGDGVYDIPHLAQLALFDQSGNLRGLFRTDSVEMAALVRAANFLLEKPGT